MSDEIVFTGWRKSAHCGPSFSCVEVASGPPVVAVRDSQDKAGPVLAFSGQTWGRFLAAVKEGARPLP